MLTTRRVVLAGAASLGIGAAPKLTSKKPPWVVGALFPLSGDAALLGDESFRGVALAVDALNATGGLAGREVRLMRADARDPTVAEAGAKALIGKEKVSVIFGTAATPMALAGSSTAALAGVPYFELTATGTAVTGRGLPTVFRSCPEADAFGVASVAAVTKVLAPLWDRAPPSLRLATLASDDELGQGVAAMQATACKSRGLALVQSLSYPAGTVDVVPLIHALKEARIGVLLHTGFANDIVLLYRGMAETGWEPGMVIGCGPAYAMADTRAAVGPALDGTLVVDFPPYAIDPHVAPGVAAVASAYQRRYGAPPRSGLSLASYVGARLFFRAMQQAGGIDQAKLRAAVLKTDVPSATTANGWGAAFSSAGQNNRASVVLAQWQNGQVTAVAPRSVAVAEAKERLRPLPAQHKPASKPARRPAP